MMTFSTTTHRKSRVFVDSFFLISVFLFTLGSHYFYQVGLYLFQITGILMLIPFFRVNCINLKSINLYVLMVFFTFSFCYGSFIAVNEGSISFSASKLFLPLFVFLWLGFASIIFCTYPLNFNHALRNVIWIHLIFFYIQFFWYITTLQAIDVLEPITGEPQRLIGGSYSAGYMAKFARMTGFYNEPGTYSSWIAILLLLLKANTRKVDQDINYYYLQAFALGSMLLSFSTFGLVFSVICLFSIIYEQKFNLWSVVYIIITIALFSYLSYDYFEYRFSLNENSSGIGSRSQVIDLYLSGLTIKTILFGYGIFNDFFSIYGNFLVYQDVGFWFYILSTTGVVGFFLLSLFLFLSVPKNAVSLALAIVLMLSKFTLTSALVWVVLYYFLWANIPLNQASILRLPGRRI